MRAIKMLKNVLVGLSFVVGLSQMAAAQTGAGTYTGTYSGADNGSMTVTIDQNGAVNCALTSAAGNGRFTGAGGVISQSPFIFTCDHHDFPNYLSVSGNGKPGGTLTGQYLVAATGTSTSKQGNFSVTASSTGGGNSGQLSPQSISGLWYDPAFNGTGFNFLVADNGFMATYYGRSAGGGLLWLISTDIPTGPVQVNTRYTLIMGNTTAGTFSSPAYEMANWGQLDVTFSSCTRATATLSGKDGVQQLNLQRLGGVAGISAC